MNAKSLSFPLLWLSRGGICGSPDEPEEATARRAMDVRARARVARFAVCFTCAVKGLGAAEEARRPERGQAVLRSAVLLLRVAAAPPQRIVFAAVAAIAS